MKKILLSLLILVGWAVSSFGAYVPYRPEIPERHFGDRKILVILYNDPAYGSAETSRWPDFELISQDFHQYFDRIFNEEGWKSAPFESNVQIPGYWYGDTWINTYTCWVKPVGSVRDYYIENSYGKYRPQFDVYGPVNISQETLRGSIEDVSVQESIVTECIESVGNQLNLDDYDTDGDGIIDFAIFSRVGATENGEKTTVNLTIRGKRIKSVAFVDTPYPGDICHEFGHYLGFGDAYDPRPESTTAGQLPNKYSLMATGNANHPFGTPPYLSAFERYYMGWIDGFETIENSGTYLLSPISEGGVYKIDTPNEGEFFLIEYHPCSRWDRFIPSFGLFIYHIDQSKRVIDGKAAIDWWKPMGVINVNSQDYPLYSIFYEDIDNRTWGLPGEDKNREVELVDGYGNKIGVTIKDIGFNGNDKAWFRADFSYSVYGKVTDVEGKPVSGVTIILKTQNGGEYSAQSDASGNYKIAMEDKVLGSTVEISVAYSDYLPVSDIIQMNSVGVKHDIILRKSGEGIPHTLQKFDESAQSTRYGAFGQSGGTVAMRYTASELKAEGLVGAKLNSISFFTGYPNKFGYMSNFYAVVYFGKEPVLVKDVTSTYSSTEWMTTDVSEDNIVIPSGKDVFIGYAIKCSCPSETGYWPSVTAFKGNHNGGYSIKDSVGEQINWSTSGNYEFMIKANVVAQPASTGGTTPSDFGIAWIEVTSEGYLEAHPAAGKTIQDEKWDDSSETLWKCTLTYTDGTTEDIWFDITPYL